MKDLLTFLSILQLTKEQPLTGYLSGGIRLHECPSLAEHHYTAAMIGYFLAQKIKEAGGVLDERKLLLMLLFHDLGELFGGDIASPLSRKYPDLREYKDKIGNRAMRMLSEILGDAASGEFRAIYDECEHGTSDEKIVAKIVDQMDHQFFMEHLNYSQRTAGADHRRRYIATHIVEKADLIRNEKTKAAVKEFLDAFLAHCFLQGFQGRKLLLDDEAAIAG